MAVQTRSPNVDPHDIPWPTLASAFAVFSALTLPLNLAQTIGATLPTKFAVDYPDNALTRSRGSEAGDYDGSDLNSGQAPLVQH